MHGRDAAHPADMAVRRARRLPRPRSAAGRGPPDDIEGRSLIGSPTRLQALLRPFFLAWSRTRENLIKGPHRYDRYGFRVPAVIVSPFARPDYVCTEVLDHTSVLKLVEQKWNLPALTARDAAARAPLDALGLHPAAGLLVPPSLPAPAGVGKLVGSRRPAAPRQLGLAVTVSSGTYLVGVGPVSETPCRSMSRTAVTCAEVGSRAAGAAGTRRCP